MTTTTTTAAENSGGSSDEATATTLSDLHQDIIESHILPRLDGPSLASTACCSTTLRRLSNHHTLWSDLCHSTWPSTTTSPLLLRLISADPHHFFSLASITTTTPSSTSLPPTTSPPPSEFISAVDIFYNNIPIFSKVQETETETPWFNCSPFRIDLLDPKDVIPTNVERPTSDDDLQTFGNHMRLSWLAVDPRGRRRRVIDLSSQEPLSVQKHWLTGEIQLKYAVILSHAQCGVVVTCGGKGSSANDVVTVKEVSLEMEDVEGKHLNGRESLEILRRAWEGNNKAVEGGRSSRAEVCKKRYEDYLEKRRERRERKLRTEGLLDRLSVAFLVVAFVSWVGIVLWRR